MNLNARVFLNEASDQRSYKSPADSHRGAYTQFSLDGFALRRGLSLGFGYLRNNALAALVEQGALFGKLECSGSSCN